MTAPTNRPTIQKRQPTTWLRHRFHQRQPLMPRLRQLLPHRLEPGLDVAPIYKRPPKRPRATRATGTASGILATPVGATAPAKGTDSVDTQYWRMVEAVAHHLAPRRADTELAQLSAYLNAHRDAADFFALLDDLAAPAGAALCPSGPREPIRRRARRLPAAKRPAGRGAPGGRRFGRPTATLPAE